MPDAPSFFNADTLRPGQIPAITLESTAEDGTKETLTITGTAGPIGVGPMKVKWRKRTAGLPWGAFSAWLTSPLAGVEITRHALRVVEVEAISRDNGICDIDCNELESESRSLNVQPKLPALTEGGVLEIDTVDTAQLVAGAVTADEITVTELSAITSNMGTIVAGVLRSASSEVVFDLTNKLLTVLDASAVTRVSIGEVLPGVFGIKAWNGGAELVFSVIQTGTGGCFILRAGIGDDVGAGASGVALKVGSQFTINGTRQIAMEGGFTAENNSETNFVGFRTDMSFDKNGKTGLKVWQFALNDFVMAGSGTIDVNAAIEIFDIVAGTTNYAIKTGQGLISFGDTVTVSVGGDAKLVVSRTSASPADAVLAVEANKGKVGTTSEDPFEIITNDIARICILSTGLVGLGTTTPAAHLEVVNASNVAPQIRLSSKLSNSITTDELIGGIEFWSNDPSEQGVSAQILVRAPANHIVGDIPGYMSIMLVKDGTNVLVERIRIQDDGDVTVAGEIISAQTGNTPGILRMQRTDGTLGNNSNIGILFFAGDEGSDQYDGASILGTAAENWQAAAKGTELEFYVTAIGAVSLAMAMVIHDDRRVRIVDKLAVDGALDVIGDLTAVNLAVSGTLSPIASMSLSSTLTVAGNTTVADIEINGDLNHDGSKAGFMGATPVTRPSVGGSRGGNAALASLLGSLANAGLITNNTS